jgi:hypothetical protein
MQPNARLRARHNLIGTRESFERRCLTDDACVIPNADPIEINYARPPTMSEMGARVRSRIYIIRAYAKPWKRARWTEIMPRLPPEWMEDVPRALTFEELHDGAADLIGTGVMIDHAVAAYPVEKPDNWNRVTGRVTRVLQTQDGTTDVCVRFYDTPEGRFAAFLVETGAYRGGSIHFARSETGIPVFREFSICPEGKRNGTGFIGAFALRAPEPLEGIVDAQVSRADHVYAHPEVESYRFDYAYEELNNFDPARLSIVSVNAVGAAGAGAGAAAARSLMFEPKDAAQFLRAYTSLDEYVAATTPREPRRVMKPARMFAGKRRATAIAVPGTDPASSSSSSSVSVVSVASASASSTTSTLSTVATAASHEKKKNSILVPHKNSKRLFRKTVPSLDATVLNFFRKYKNSDPTTSSFLSTLCHSGQLTSFAGHPISSTNSSTMSASPVAPSTILSTSSPSAPASTVGIADALGSTGTTSAASASTPIVPDTLDGGVDATLVVAMDTSMEAAAAAAPTPTETPVGAPLFTPETVAAFVAWQQQQRAAAAAAQPIATDMTDSETLSSPPETAPTPDTVMRDVGVVGADDDVVGAASEEGEDAAIVNSRLAFETATAARDAITVLLKKCTSAAQLSDLMPEITKLASHLEPLVRVAHSSQHEMEQAQKQQDKMGEQFLTSLANIAGFAANAPLTETNNMIQHFNKAGQRIADVRIRDLMPMWNQTVSVASNRVNGERAIQQAEEEVAAAAAADSAAAAAAEPGMNAARESAPLAGHVNGVAPPANKRGIEDAYAEAERKVTPTSSSIPSPAPTAAATAAAAAAAIAKDVYSAPSARTGSAAASASSTTQLSMRAQHELEKTLLYVESLQNELAKNSTTASVNAAKSRGAAPKRKEAPIGGAHPSMMISVNSGHAARQLAVAAQQQHSTAQSADKRRMFGSSRTGRGADVGGGGGAAGLGFDKYHAIQNQYTSAQDDASDEAAPMPAALPVNGANKFVDDFLRNKHANLNGFSRTSKSRRRRDDDDDDDNVGADEAEIENYMRGGGGINMRA